MNDAVEWIVNGFAFQQKSILMQCPHYSRPPKLTGSSPLKNKPSRVIERPQISPLIISSSRPYEFDLPLLRRLMYDILSSIDVVSELVSKCCTAEQVQNWLLPFLPHYTSVSQFESICFTHDPFGSIYFILSRQFFRHPVSLSPST